MNKKIKLALVTLLSEETKVSSWGISNISIGSDFISFNVEGFIYTGNVLVRNKNLDYEIVFNKNKTLLCSLDELVDVLDCNIEKSQNYLCDLEKWLFL